MTNQRTVTVPVILSPSPYSLAKRSYKIQSRWIFRSFICDIMRMVTVCVRVVVTMTTFTGTVTFASHNVPSYEHSYKLFFIYSCICDILVT